MAQKSPKKIPSHPTVPILTLRGKTEKAREAELDAIINALESLDKVQARNPHRPPPAKRIK